MLPEAEHRNECLWGLLGIATGGGRENWSLTSSMRRGHWRGGRLGCLRPSFRALWDDPRKPSIKVQARGSTERKSGFISQACCILMLTGMAVARWQIQWGMTPFPCSWHVLAQVQGKYTAKCVRYTACPENEKFKREKKGVGQPINCHEERKQAKRAAGWNPAEEAQCLGDRLAVLHYFESQGATRVQGGKKQDSQGDFCCW